MVLIGGRPCLATVVSTPFFDPAGKFAGAIERMEDWADIARPVETRAAQPG